MNINQLVRHNIRELEPYHSARETIQRGILLDANENPYAQEWCGIQLNRYPDPNQTALRLALADYVGVSAENVLAGTGSDEVLDWLLKVFCEPGKDKIAIAEPTYGMYRVMADIYGASVHAFRLNVHFDFDAAQFMRSLPGDVKLLFLCSPNNPTGNLLDRGEILRLCREWQQIVVVDEAYIEFAEQPSLAAEIRRTPNLVLMRTLSKAFGRAALRLGYAVAVPEIIRYCRRVKAPYNLSAFVMEGGRQALEQFQTVLRCTRMIQQERERLAAGLRQIDQLKKVFPSDANFILFQCPDAREVCSRLCERGVIVRDRSSAPGLDGCIRVSVGKREENDLFLSTLGEILKGVS